MTDEPEDIDDGEEEEFDWGEAERKAQMWEKLAEVHNRVMNQKFVPVPLIKLPKGTRFDITTFSEGHDPMECTLLDPATVRDNYYFPQSTTCVLWGSVDLDGKGAQLPGIIKHNAKVVFEKDGKRLGDRAGPSDHAAGAAHTELAEAVQSVGVAGVRFHSLALKRAQKGPEFCRNRTLLMRASESRGPKNAANSNSLSAIPNAGDVVYPPDDRKERHLMSTLAVQPIRR